MVVVSEIRSSVEQLIVQTKASSEPVVLTTNGEAELVLLTPAAYQALLERIDILDSVIGMYKAEREFERGEGRPAREALEELRLKLGVPR